MGLTAAELCQLGGSKVCIPGSLWRSALLPRQLNYVRSRLSYLYYVYCLDNIPGRTTFT